MADGEVLFKVEVDAAAALEQLTQLSSQVETLKNRNSELKSGMKELDTSTKEGAKAFAQMKAELQTNTQNIKTLETAEKSLTNQLNAAKTEVNALSDSFKDQARKLALLKEQYSSLSAEQRRSPMGKEMLNSLQKLDAEVKKNDASMGNFQRNVGNYPKLIGNVNNSLKAIFANPLIMGLAGIVKLFQTLADKFKENDTASTNLKAAMENLRPVLQIIESLFQGLVNVIVKGAEYLGKFVGWVTDLIGISTKEEREAASQLVRDLDTLEDREQAYTKAFAYRQAEFTRLMKQARETEKYTAEERKKFLNEAMALQQKDLKESKAIARDKYMLRLREIAIQKAYIKADATELELMQAMSKEGKNWAALSDEIKGELVGLEAAIDNVQTRFEQATTRLATQENRLTKEIKSDEAEITKTYEQETQKSLKFWANYWTDWGKKLEDANKLAKKEKKELIETLEAMTNQRIADNEWEEKRAKEWAKTELGVTQKVAGAYAELSAGMSQVFSAMGEEGSAFAAFGKALAIAESIFNIQKAIAAATAAGAGLTFPANLVAMASGIATVMANVAGIISAIKSVAIPESPKFSSGGVVPGTSFSGDKVTAGLNSGEVVLNSGQQSNLLMKLAKSQSPVIQQDMNMLQSALVNALRSMPSPVLTYREFNNFQQKVVKYKEYEKF